MIRKTIFTCGLLAATACSAQPQTSRANTPVAMPQPPEASRPVPANAPRDPSIRNIPATTGHANRAETPPPFTVTRIGRFDTPFAMAFLPGGRLLVTEKKGHLELRAADGSVRAVGGVPRVVFSDQGGLLDIAPAPDYAASHTVYLSYSEPGAKGSALALARATLGDGASPALKGLRVIWRAGSNGPGEQFGSIITFSPDGRLLYLTSGERQRFSPAQDPAQALGKIVRLTLDGAPAPGNPMAAAGGVRAMTWTSGHRNPYGLAFAPDGRLWEIEMGPMGGDELNLIEPGRNYGWPIVSNGDNYSGQPIPDHPSKPEFAAPKLWWNPSISPAGLMIYSGAMFPQYRGSAFIGALSGEALIRVTLAGGTATPADQWAMGARIRDVAQAPDGAIWLLEDDGPLVRLTPKR